MPTFIPIPKPIGAQYLQEEITANWVSTVDSQLSIPLGLNTVEEWIPQHTEDPVRNYNRSDYPAVWCYTTFEGIGEHAAQMIDLIYQIHWGVAVFNGQVKDARKFLERIREEIGTLFGSWSMAGTTTFLDETATACNFGNFEFGDPQMGTESRPYLFWALNAMDVRVSTPNISY